MSQLREQALRAKEASYQLALAGVSQKNEALSNIAETTTLNIKQMIENGQCPNELCYRGGNTDDCKSGKCF